MNDEIAELKNLLIEFNGARLPTTKAAIGEKVIKLLIPVVIHQSKEIFALKQKVSKLCL